MSSANSKGKGVDWQATAKMLSISNAQLLPDEEAEHYWTAEAAEAFLPKTADSLYTSDSFSAPAQQEAVQIYDTIRLIYDIDEMKVAKANHSRFPPSRSAPPPPYRVIAPKLESTKGCLDTSYVAAAEGENMGMGEFNDIGGLTESWHNMKQSSWKEMKTADSASLQILTPTPEPEPEPEPEYIALERWECHECNLFHPIDNNDSGWDSHDPNVCKCCNHDRCSKCWDLDENGWRVQFCDGAPLDTRAMD